MSGALSKTSHAVILGPTDIRAITDALDILLPWITQSKMVITPDGHLDITEPEPSEAVTMLREAVEKFLPEETLEYLGIRSGLGWPSFSGMWLDGGFPSAGTLVS